MTRRLILYSCNPQDGAVEHIYRINKVVYSCYWYGEVATSQNGELFRFLGPIKYLERGIERDEEVFSCRKYKFPAARTFSIVS